MFSRFFIHRPIFAAVISIVIVLAGLLAGQGHRVLRPQPRGTMRGAPVLVGAHAQGAASLSITGGTAGSTLLAGDMLGVGGLLLMVQIDVTLDGAGAGSVPITNRLRSAQSGGAAVTWDKPTALFRLVDHSGPVYSPGLASAPSFSFREKV